MDHDCQLVHDSSARTADPAATSLGTLHAKSEDVWSHAWHAWNALRAPASASSSVRITARSPRD